MELPCTTTSELYCMQLIEHELRSRKGKQINSVSCRHFQMIFLGLSLENRVLLFA